MVAIILTQNRLEMHQCIPFTPNISGILATAAVAKVKTIEKLILINISKQAAKISKLINAESQYQRQSIGCLKPTEICNIK